MRPVRLKARGGVGIRVLRAIEPETIMRPGARCYCTREITRSLSIQRMAFTLDHHLQTLCLRRPDPKMRLAIDQLRSNRICAFCFGHPTPSLRVLWPVVREFSFRLVRCKLQRSRGDQLHDARNHRTLHEMAAYAVAGRHG